MNTIKKRKLRSRMLAHRGIASALSRFRSLDHAIQWYTYPVWERLLNKRDTSALTAFFDRVLTVKTELSRFLGNLTLPQGSCLVTQNCCVYHVSVNPLFYTTRFSDYTGEYVCVMATQLISADRRCTYTPGRTGIVLPLHWSVDEASVEQVVLDALGESRPHRVFFYWK